MSKLPLLSFSFSFIFFSSFFLLLFFSIFSFSPSSPPYSFGPLLPVIPISFHLHCPSCLPPLAPAGRHNHLSPAVAASSHRRPSRTPAIPYTRTRWREEALRARGQSGQGTWRSSMEVCGATFFGSTLVDWLQRVGFQELIRWSCLLAPRLAGLRVESEPEPVSEPCQTAPTCTTLLPNLALLLTVLPRPSSTSGLFLPFLKRKHAS